MTVVAIRHGETEWSLSGQHTGTTDIPLTNNGRRPRRTDPACACQGSIRARSVQPDAASAGLAGPVDKTVIDSDLVEWNYGAYKGLTPKQTDSTAPGWLIFREGCPGGETPEQVDARADR